MSRNRDEGGTEEEMMRMIERKIKEHTPLSVDGKPSLPLVGSLGASGFLSGRTDFGLFVTSAAESDSFIFQVVQGLNTLSSLDFLQKQRQS